MYHPCVPAGSTKPLKTKNFTFFQALRQTLAEREGFDAGAFDIPPLAIPQRGTQERSTVGIFVISRCSASIGNSP